MEVISLVNIEPHIEVYDVAKIQQSSYGNAGKIALIGAFPNNTVSVEIFTEYDEARNALKGEYRTIDDNSVANASRDPVPDTYTAFYCLDYIFNSSNQSRGAESVLIVNTNYENDTLVQVSTNQMIADACTLLAEEDFDILTIGEPVTLVVSDNETYILNPIWQTLKTFENSQYLSQKPFGVITGIDLTNGTAELVGSFKTLWANRGIFKIVATPVRLNGASASLNIAESGCWHSAFTAGRAVNKSETAKQYDELIGENSKDAFPLTADITWRTLLNNGFHTTKYRNRRLGTIQCLSNVTPADYDMKIERVKNYIIKRLTLADVLGDDNNKTTRDYIKGMFEYEKRLAMNNNYLVDMEYNLVNISTDKVKANLKLYIPDIIRVVELDVTVEIAAYEEA